MKQMNMTGKSKEKGRQSCCAPSKNSFPLEKQQLTDEIFAVETVLI